MTVSPPTWPSTDTAELTRVRRRRSRPSRAPPGPRKPTPGLRRLACGCDPAARLDSADFAGSKEGSHVTIHLLCLALADASIHPRPADTRVNPRTFSQHS